jgi:hypothetical protein
MLFSLTLNLVLLFIVFTVGQNSPQTSLGSDAQQGEPSSANSENLAFSMVKEIMLFDTRETLSDDKIKSLNLPDIQVTADRSTGRIVVGLGSNSAKNLYDVVLEYYGNDGTIDSGRVSGTFMTYDANTGTTSTTTTTTSTSPVKSSSGASSVSSATSSSGSSYANTVIEFSSAGLTSNVPSYSLGKVPDDNTGYTFRLRVYYQGVWYWYWYYWTPWWRCKYWYHPYYWFCPCNCWRPIWWMWNNTWWYWYQGWYYPYWYRCWYWGWYPNYCYWFPRCWWWYWWW